MLGVDLATSRHRLSDTVRLLGWRPAVVLAAWFGLVAVATGVWHNVPLIDDWTYAWTVERLLHAGTFEVLDWSSAYPLSQALWGAAWSALLGFSFATLRLSTLVLGVVGCGALYLLLRELGTSPRIALLGALSLAVNPVFVFLSSSFMTDVPFTTFTTIALLCYVRAANRGELRFVWWAGVWCLAAFLVRQVGIVTPVAGLPLLLLRPGHPTMTRFRVAASLAVTWAVIGITLIVMRHQLGTTSVMDRWTWNLLARPSSYLAMNAPLLLQISVFLLPVLLAAAGLYNVWRKPLILATGLVLMGSLFLLVLGEIPQPLSTGDTWTLHEVGASRALVGGRLATHDPLWVSALLRTLGLLAATILCVVWLTRHGPVRAWSPVRATLLAYVAVYLVLINLLWMYLDRYSLALMPPLIALTLGGANRTAVGYPRLATVVLVIFAVVALLGTRGALRFNQAVADVWQSLIEAGVPASDIDAGYAWNGWMLYAHPTNLAPGLTPLRDVPWVTSDRKTEYVIAKAPLEGYAVERELAWHDLPWPGPDRLFVLRQIRGGATDSSATPAPGTSP